MISPASLCRYRGVDR